MRRNSTWEVEKRWKQKKYILLEIYAEWIISLFFCVFPRKSKAKHFFMLKHRPWVSERTKTFPKISRERAWREKTLHWCATAMPAKAAAWSRLNFKGYGVQACSRGCHWVHGASSKPLRKPFNEQKTSLSFTEEMHWVVEKLVRGFGWAHGLKSPVFPGRGCLCLRKWQTQDELERQSAFNILGSDPGFNRLCCVMSTKQIFKDEESKIIIKMIQQLSEWSTIPNQVCIIYNSFSLEVNNSFHYTNINIS